MLALSLALVAAVSAQVPGGADLEDRYGARWTPEAAVYQSASPSVVRVRLEARVDSISASFGPIEIGGTGERWLGVSNGTGVVYSERGLVITNAHVVETREDIAAEDQRLRVVLSAEAAGEDEVREFEARLLALDPAIDLALLQIDSDRTFLRIPFGRENDLLIGEKVVALGAPFGRSLMLSSGILSALNQEVLVADSDGVTKRMGGLIQTDAAVNEGFSGGPMMNTYGELIGLTVSRVEAAAGIAYAIPIAQINASLRDRLLGNTWAGMEVVAAEPGGWPKVERVHPRGPAARAGMEVGDRILIANGKPLARLGQWADELANLRAGDAMEIVVRGAGESRRARGMTLELVDAGLRDTLGLFGAEFSPGSYSVRSSSGQGRRVYECPRIESVFPGSPADRLGLQRGDLVLMVGVDDERYPRGWQKVRTASEMTALMRGPTFRVSSENIWIVRSDETFRGMLPIDDPTIANRVRSTQLESPEGR